MRDTEGDSHAFGNACFQNVGWHPRIVCKAVRCAVPGQWVHRRVTQECFLV